MRRRPALVQVNDAFGFGGSQQIRLGESRGRAFPQQPWVAQHAQGGHTDTCAGPLQKRAAGPKEWIVESHCSVLSAQFSVLSSQCSVLSAQCSVLSAQFSVLSCQLSVVGPQLSMGG